MTTRRQVLKGIAATVAGLLTFAESIGQAGISVDEFAGVSGKIVDEKIITTLTTTGIHGIDNNVLLNVGDILQINFSDQITVNRIVSIVRNGDRMDLELVEERNEGEWI